jgi:hypothetical protein
MVRGRRKSHVAAASLRGETAGTFDWAGLRHNLPSFRMTPKKRQRAFGHVEIETDDEFGFLELQTHDRGQ